MHSKVYVNISVYFRTCTIHTVWSHVLPVCEGGDDQTTRVAQVLVAISKVCVGLFDDTVVYILHKQIETFRLLCWLTFSLFYKFSQSL